MEFVIASHNQKKIREIAAILGTLGISFEPLPGGAPEPEETGPTFEENALIKARAACALTGKPAIADDSGLAVDALGGAPGIYSARYCEGSDLDRNAFLLRSMEGIPDGRRQARFVSAVACAFPNGDALTVRGECGEAAEGGEAGEALEAHAGALHHRHIHALYHQFSCYTVNHACGSFLWARPKAPLGLRPCAGLTPTGLALHFSRTRGVDTAHMGHWPICTLGERMPASQAMKAPAGGGLP